MASLIQDPNGTYRVLLVCSDKKRRTIRLGKVNKKAAEDFHKRLEHLNELVSKRLPIDTETAAWIVDLSDDFAEKLATVGLIPPRASRVLSDFLKTYLDNRKAESKPGTLMTLRRVQDDLIGLYGKNTNLADIGPEQADQLKTHYLKQGLASATIHRRLKMARMFFERAKKYKLISENPFAEVKCKDSQGSERQHFISIDDTKRMLAVSNPTWQTIIALCRHAGLRCPSEVLSLKWENVDFASGRITTPSPKTEHHEGKGSRVLPIFPALRPYLEDAFELAEPGEEYVVGGPQGKIYRAASHGPNGWVNVNLRTTFSKIVKRAGLTMWPRIFQNLRSSLETELMQSHPIHVVTAWMGNTPKVAMLHYLQTLDSDFAKALGIDVGTQAAQKAAQSGRDTKQHEPPTIPKSPSNVGFSRILSDTGVHCEVEGITPQGFEP